MVLKWTQWLYQSIDWLRTSMFRPNPTIQVSSTPSGGNIWNYLSSLSLWPGGSFHFWSWSVMEEVYCSLQLQPRNSWANRCRNKGGQSLRWMFCHYFTPPVSFPAACTPVSGIKVAFQLPEEHVFYELFQQIKVLNGGDVLVDGFWSETADVHPLSVFLSPVVTASRSAIERIKTSSSLLINY